MHLDVMKVIPSLMLKGSFMRAGVPISEMKYFRGILEENAMRLTDVSHMFQLVPFVLEQEKSLLKEEIKGKHLYDGTSRLGEVLAVVVRYVNEWKVYQRLVRLEILVKSMAEEEVARQLITGVSKSLVTKIHMNQSALKPGPRVPPERL